MKTIEEKAKDHLIIQGIFHNGGDIILLFRYDYKSQLLYRQNRSYDQNICLDDFLDRLKISVKKMKANGYSFKQDFVLKDSAWPRENIL